MEGERGQTLDLGIDHNIKGLTPCEDPDNWKGCLMAQREGDVVMITLACGCSERRVTLLHGKQTIRCPTCRNQTVVLVEINRNGTVGRFRVRPW